MPSGRPGEAIGGVPGGDADLAIRDETGLRVGLDDVFSIEAVNGRRPDTAHLAQRDDDPQHAPRGQALLGGGEQRLRTGALFPPQKNAVELFLDRTDGLAGDGLRIAPTFSSGSGKRQQRIRGIDQQKALRSLEVEPERQLGRVAQGNVGGRGQLDAREKVQTT